MIYLKQGELLGELDLFPSAYALRTALGKSAEKTEEQIDANFMQSG
jgi:hypothetical protein